MRPQTQISVDERALHEAARDIFTSLGPLNDLGPELSNTVANVYYRFHVMSQNMGNPGDALGVKPGKDMPSNFLNLAVAMGTAMSEYKYIAKLIESLREARAQNPSIGDFLITHALDEFKYHIKNANKKSLIRRSIERPFCKVDEIAGLYDRIVQLRGVIQGRQSVVKSDVAIDPIQAIKSGDLAELRRFIQASPRSLDITYEPNQWTLLHWLAGLGSALRPVHSTMALELISAGADVNCRTPLGWTPLIIIAIAGQKEAVPLAKLLIEHGADVAAVDKGGADWSIFWQHGEEIRAILNAAMTPAQRETNRLGLERLYSPKTDP